MVVERVGECTAVIKGTSSVAGRGVAGEQKRKAEDGVALRVLPPAVSFSAALLWKRGMFLSVLIGKENKT